MAKMVTAADNIEADCRKAMAELADLPHRRRWDIEADRLSKRAEVEHLLDDWLHVNSDGQATTPHA